MAIFGKSDRPVELVKRVQNRDYRDQTELSDLLQGIMLMPGIKARNIVWMLGHPEPYVREFGQSQVERMNGDGVTDALLREMMGKSPSIAQDIAMTMIQLDPVRAQSKIGPLLHSNKVEQRAAALDIMACFENVLDFFAHLKVAVKDPEPSIRIRAVKQLGAHPHEPAVRIVLQNLLNEQDLTVRQVAIEVLAENPTPDLAEPFLERLPYESTRTQTRMVSALSELARDSTARLHDQLLPMLGDDHEIVRNAAVKLLREVPNRKQVIRSFIVFSQGLAHWVRDRCRDTFLTVGRDVLQSVMELIHEGTPEIKVGAMLLASDGKNEMIVPHLIDVLHSDDDWWVRIVAVDELMRYPQPEVVDTLINKLGDTEITFAIICALGKIDNKKCVRALLPYLTAPQSSIRRATIQALGQYDDPQVIDALARVVLDDNDDVIRDIAMQTLKQLGGAAENVEAAVREVLAKRAAESPVGEYIELSMANPSL